MFKCATRDQLYYKNYVARASARINAWQKLACLLVVGLVVGWFPGVARLHLQDVGSGCLDHLVVRQMRVLDSILILKGVEK